MDKCNESGGDSMKAGDLVYWMYDIPCIVIGRAKHTDLTHWKVLTSKGDVIYALPSNLSESICK